MKNGVKCDISSFELACIESRLLEASSWCPGLVSAQYFTSFMMRCASLKLARELCVISYGV